MKINEFYAQELNNENTRYFIIVSGDHKNDKDFVQYTWRRSRFNKVRSGDLFLYRKKDKNKIIGEFFFYGLGKFGDVEGENRVISKIEKPLRFDFNVTKSDLIDFKWKWKERGENWANFFNQYGMDSIPKEDFIRLLEKGFEPEKQIEDLAETTSEFLNQFENENYYVDDNIGLAKRRRGQQDFSEKVKSNYGFKCCICGIKTKSFLIGSHIIPWRERKDIRLDPSNGLSLCSFHDKSFDKGYISIDDEFTIIVSHNIKDGVLRELLSPIRGNKIKVPRRQKPKTEYLDFHRSEIFESFLG